MNNAQAITNPTSMAAVKVEDNGRKKVISRTATSDLGFFNNPLNLSIHFILLETITSTPARQAIHGIYCANGIQEK